MPTIPVSVSGGRVTSKDRSLLQPGELTVATNVEYHVNDPAAHQVPGRTVFNAAAEAAAIVGLEYLEYDTEPDRILISGGTELKTATAGSTGTFASIPELKGESATAATTVITTPTAADAAHYNDRYYYMDGVNGPYMIGNLAPDQGVGTVRAYSTLNVRMAEPAALTLDNLGTGSGFLLSANNTIQLWYQEIVMSALVAGTDTIGIDSVPGIIAYNADTASEVYMRGPASARVTITGTGATIFPTITFPATPTNPQATHRLLFITGTNDSFPNGIIKSLIFNSAGANNVDLSPQTVTDPLASDWDSNGFSSAIIFPILTIISDGVQASFQKSGQIPIASTGDIFEDSLVINDTSDNTLIRYSFPDDPTAFPDSNYIRFETKRQDTVTCIRTMGNSLIVGMTNSIWRVALLPRPEDATFDRGRIRSIISSNHGIVGPHAATTFGFGGRSGDSPELLAFVSRAGVLSTNGYAWDVLTDDVDWENTVETSLLSQCALVNNSKKFRLELYYTPKGGTANTEAMYLHYHPSHAKSTIVATDNRVKATWPINAKVTAATPAVISGSVEIFTANPNGVIYLEGQGNTDNSDAGGNAMALTTGLYFGDGIGGQSDIERVAVQHPARAGQTAAASLTLHNSGATDHVDSDPSVPLDRNEATYVSLGGQADGHQLGFSATGGQTPVAINYFVIKGEAQGESREP